MSGKAYIHGIIATLVLFCSSCVEDYEANRLMNKVEQLFDTNPDSAQAILDEVEYLIYLDSDFARWCLLSGKVEDELRKTRRPKSLPSADNWRRAKAHYDKHGTPEEKAEVRLYLGRSLYDHGNYDEAVAVYKEGLDFAQTANVKILSGYLCSYLGDLYLDKELVSPAVEKYQEAAEFHRQGGNLRSQILALRDLGHCYIYDELYDDALLIFEKMDSMSNKIEDKIVKSLISNSIGVVYEEMQDYDTAEKFYLKSLEIDTLDQGTVYYNLSILFTKKGDYEKARYYLDKVASDVSKDVVFHQHYRIEKAEGNADSALFYIELYQQGLDSIRKEQNKINVHEVEQKYDRSQAANKERQLRVRIQQLVIIVLILFITIVLSHLLYRRRKNEQLVEKQAVIEQKDNEYHILLAKFKDKNRLLSEQEKQSQDFLQQKQELEKMRSSLIDGKLELLKQSPTGQKLVKLSEKGLTSKSTTLSKKEWSALEGLVKNAFPTLYVHVLETLSGSSVETFQLCLLSFFELKTKEEAFLIGKSEEAIRQNHVRIRRLFNIKSPQKLRMYFQNFIELNH